MNPGARVSELCPIRRLSITVERITNSTESRSCFLSASVTDRLRFLGGRLLRVVMCREVQRVLEE